MNSLGTFSAHTANIQIWTKREGFASKPHAVVRYLHCPVGLRLEGPQHGLTLVNRGPFTQDFTHSRFSLFHTELSALLSHRFKYRFFLKEEGGVPQGMRSQKIIALPTE